MKHREARSMTWRSHSPASLRTAVIDKRAQGKTAISAASPRVMEVICYVLNSNL
jgi:hypothetical protein